MTHLWSDSVTQSGSTQLNVQAQSDSSVPLSDVPVIRKGTALAAKVYRKTTHHGRYLISNLTIRCVWKEVEFRTSTICRERQDLLIKLVALDVIFSSTVIPEVSMTRLLIPRAAFSRIKKESLWDLCMSHVSMAFRRIKRTVNRYDNRMIFKTKHILSSPLMKTRPEGDPQETAQCVRTIPCGCGTSHIDETDRLMQPHEYRNNLKEGLLENQN
jgi:hypothetical protein